jgi:hypothetical protein
MACFAEAHITANSDTLTPAQVVQDWVESAQTSGQEDSYEAKRDQARCSWPQPLELLVDGEVVYVRARDICGKGTGLITKRNLNVDEEVFVRRDASEPWIKCRVTHVTKTIGSYKIGAELLFDYQ